MWRWTKWGRSCCWILVTGRTRTSMVSIISIGCWWSRWHVGSPVRRGRRSHKSSRRRSSMVRLVRRHRVLRGRGGRVGIRVRGGVIGRRWTIDVGAGFMIPILLVSRLVHLDIITFFRLLRMKLSVFIFLMDSVRGIFCRFCRFLLFANINSATISYRAATSTSVLSFL